METEDYLERREAAREEDESFDRDLGKENLARLLEGGPPAACPRTPGRRHRDGVQDRRRVRDRSTLDRARDGGPRRRRGVRRAGRAGGRWSLVLVGLEVRAPKHHLRDTGPAVRGRCQGGDPDGCTDPPTETPRRLCGLGRSSSESAAIGSVTRVPAEILGIEDRVGTLAPGTDADVVVWDGPFYHFDTSTEHVFVDGKHIFDHERDAVDPREAWAW